MLIGEHFESLHNIENEALTPKLKAPLLRYVIRPPEGENPIRCEGCTIVASYAAGGLANAWGAQVYRFDDRDLAGYPLKAQDLSTYYDDVEREIGISGVEDDLARFHGSQHLLPPLDLGRVARDLLGRYEGKRAAFHRRGVFMGRPRLAVLSTDYRGRAAYGYDSMEFFRPQTAGIYTPVCTLDSLIRENAVDYRPGWLVERFQEHEDRVEVFAVSIGGDERAVFQARALVLCLGALNTAKLVLRSADDQKARLPVVENPMSMCPVISIRHIGCANDDRSHSAQLNLICEVPETGDRIVAMLYSLEGLLRSDILPEFPLDARGCLSAARAILPATMVLQVFRAGRVDPGNHVGIDGSGRLVVEFRAHTVDDAEKRILGALRRIGYLGHSRFIRRPIPGGSIHYAGTLPMRATPSRPYETDPSGRLHGSRRVHIGDSATFPALPAKNLTLTIMSNAARVATLARARLEAE